jgi:hypothetical protein
MTRAELIALEKANVQERGTSAAKWKGLELNRIFDDSRTHGGPPSNINAETVRHGEWQ